VSTLTVIVTGSEGYLMRQLIARLDDAPEVQKIIGIDIREKSEINLPKYQYVHADVTERHISYVVREWVPASDFLTVVHAAWTFNPTHDIARQDTVDIGGTINVSEMAVDLNASNFIYLGSTTAYAPLADNPAEPPFLWEDDYERNKNRRQSTAYRYARNKAIADGYMQRFKERHPKMNVFWVRGAIVLGENTRNIVTYVAESPFTFGKFMFRVRGCDPPMQFLSEFDMAAILYRACINPEKWQGPVNAAGFGTVKYSEVIRALGRKPIVLPAWLLYPLAELLWRLRILKFPASLIDLIRYPWVGNTHKLRHLYHTRYSSRDALEQFAQAVRQKKR